MDAKWKMKTSFPAFHLLTLKSSLSGREMKDPGDEVSKMNESLVWSLTLSQNVWNTKILYLI